MPITRFQTIHADDPPLLVVLGRQGENGYREISFDVSAWLEDLPGGVVTIVFQRSDGELYPVVVNAATSPVGWIPDSAAMATSGYGKLELRLVRDGIVGKSAVVRTVTEAALGSTGEPPSPPAPDWTVTVAENAAAVMEAAAHCPTVGADKHWYVWSDGQWVDTGVTAEGTRGSDANVTADNVNAAFADATAVQKLTARENIGAVGTGDMDSEVREGLISNTQITSTDYDAICTTIGAERKQGDYELIEEITLTEPATQVVRSQEPDATPYNFLSVIVRFTVPQSAATGSVVSFFVGANDVTTRALCASSMSTSGTRYSQSRAWAEGGYIRATGVSNGASDTGQAMTICYDRYDGINTVTPPIKRMYFQSSSSNNPFPVGTIFTIWAVRA